MRRVLDLTLAGAALAAADALIESMRAAGLDVALGGAHEARAAILTAIAFETAARVPLAKGGLVTVRTPDGRKRPDFQRALESVGPKWITTSTKSRYAREDGREDGGNDWLDEVDVERVRRGFPARREP